MTEGNLTVQNVVKSYGDKTILNDVSFEAKNGEFIVLVGPSGCGKSTLLRSIAGLENIDSGSIRISGKDVSPLPPKDRNVAMVFQDYALYPHMTVKENISFGLRIRKLPNDEIEKRVNEAAAKLGLVEFLSRKPKQLSGGQRQRVAIGRAIVRHPDVFLFDEPLSNLDAKLRGQMRIRIAKLHNEIKRTSVYVTHDQIEAMTLADRIIVLNGGHIQQIGSPLDLYNRPSNQFVATFIGSPAMNLLPGNFVKDGDHLKFQGPGGSNVTLPKEHASSLINGKETKDILWGLRPECIEMDKNNADSDWTGVVEVIEPLGDSTSVICNVGGEELQLTLRGEKAPKVGDKVPLKFVGKYLYAFDKQTGLNILSEER